MLSNAREGAALAPPGVRETFGGVPTPIYPERQNFYEAGLQQALFGKFSLNASYYHQEARDPRTIADIVVGYVRTRDGKPKYDISARCTNLFDTTALYNFQSIFVGTRLVQPRTAGVRLRWYF